MSDKAWREQKLEHLKARAEQHLVWFNLARHNYLSACSKSAWLTVDNAMAQRKMNLKAMAKRIVQHDRAVVISEGYRP